MTLLESLFWFSVGALLYVYAGYPLLALGLARWAPRRVAKRQTWPTVSIVVAAYNEARHIAATIENKLALHYPPEKRQIIVVSDGSTDGTDDIVARYASAGVVGIRQEPRDGKTAALNRAVERATGEIIVFSDANSIYEESALELLTANFADHDVGYVTGSLVYQNPDGALTPGGCSMYMRYENFIRRCETTLGSVVGVNGGIDAVRRCLYTSMEPGDLPDFVLPLRVVEAGRRVVYEPGALMAEAALSNSRDEYRMRVRVSLRALWTLFDLPHMLSPRRYGLFAWQLWSHKVLRYFAFGFLAIALFSSAGLSASRQGLIYDGALLGQLGFLAAATAGWAIERAGRHSRLLYLPFYFCLVNLAAVHAFLKFARRERHRVWTPRLG